VSKVIPIALAATLALAATTAFADDSSSASTHMQNCVSKLKAKNDGRTDAQINQACADKIARKSSTNSSTGASPNDMMPGNGPASSATTPSSPTYPNNTTPNENNQVPK
jgi:hypothetical protein